MKLSCYNKYVIILIFLSLSLFANQTQKSAIVYYGEDISYPMVGVHDYIIVQPNLLDTNRHGFSLYRDKIYAYISIGEIDTQIASYKKLDKKLIIGQNSAWKGKILNIQDPAYKEFLFKEMIEPQIAKGFKNFFFDTLDSYQIVAKTKEQRAKSEAALVEIINTFHKRYPDAKLIINRGFEIIDKVHESIEAILFESYYNGLGGNTLEYKLVHNNDRSWLDMQLEKVRKYKVDIIALDYLPLNKMPTQANKLIKKLQKKGFIPYVSTKELDIYGYTSKKVVKREILTLINENTYDKIFSSAHQLGALPLEYQGYIQKLYNIDKHKLPSMQRMQRYGGVIIWLDTNYKKPQELIKWILNLQHYGIKVLFAGNFAIADLQNLLALGIYPDNTQQKNNTFQIVTQNSMMAYEISPSINPQDPPVDILQGEALYRIENQKGVKSTYAAIMPWGGFALDSAFNLEIQQDRLWAINPFEFFKKALDLKDIPIADTTTASGKRILISHIDGDGIINKVEWNQQLFSGDTIYSDILSHYKIPISVSVIGAEINTNGLYPKLAPQLQKIVKKIFSLPNVEPATHTFTHPFFWDKIKDGNLDSQYRLKPKGYKFSLDYETKGMLEEINTKLIPKNKEPKATTVFWSGDCRPPANILRYVYKNKILNINGGDTYITNLHPWLSYIAPMGLERQAYYQIYTGAQNENVYTNEWLGPFWGYKKVVQTFKLTDKPKRFKPIDIYYHLYSGSKKASLNALKYVYDWAISQEVTPLFTSEYIKKVMDYYEISIEVKKENTFYVAGLKNLKTLRFTKMHHDIFPQINKDILGYNSYNDELYLHLANNTQAFITFQQKLQQKTPYLVSANSYKTTKKVKENGFSLQFQAHVPLEFELYLPKQCSYNIEPKEFTHINKNLHLKIKYKTSKEAKVNVQCKL